MKKRAAWIIALIIAVALCVFGAWAEEADPIVTSIEITPSKLTGPGQIRVSITISNSGSEDMKDPVTLYDPSAQVVTDFGTNGEALLKAGESKTWTGTYDVNQRTLESGSVTYFVKYVLYNDSGKAIDQSQPIMAKISLQTAETDIEVQRYAPTVARNGQDIVVRYSISNTGTVNLTNITVTENKDICKDSQSISVLKPGQTVEIKYPVTMGKSDLTSGATITYTSETQTKKQTYKMETLTIKHGESSMTATLAASAKGVIQNGTVTLTFTLKNTGNLDYSDIRITDPTLGDVFTNQELKSGETLELEKEVTVPQTMDFCFSVVGVDSTGAESACTTDTVSVTAVDPADALTLNVTAAADRSEVFENPAYVRFTITIENPSNVAANNAVLSHGDTEIYDIGTIAAGETKVISRDFALSMQGKYRFSVSAEDTLENVLEFTSNDILIVFSNPTAVPATATPAPQPTATPVFQPSPLPQRSDADVAPVQKTIKYVANVLFIVFLVILGLGLILLLAAGIRKFMRYQASKAAVDQLECSEHRDYNAEGEKNEKDAEDKKIESDEAPLDVELPEDYELPHMKYLRDESNPDGDEYDQPQDDSIFEEDVTIPDEAPQNASEEKTGRSRRTR